MATNNKNDFEEKYARIEDYIAEFNKEAIKLQDKLKDVGKRRKTKIKKGLAVMTLIGAALLYTYCDIRYASMPIIRMLGGIKLKFWILPLVFVLIYLIYVSDRTATDLKNMHVAWLRKTILPVLYPGFYYYIPDNDVIYSKITELYPECTVNTKGHLENDDMEIYEAECVNETGVKIFSGLMIFVENELMSDSRLNEIISHYETKYNQDITIHEEKEYYIITCAGTSLDDFNDQDSYTLNKDIIKKSYDFISCLQASKETI